MLVGIPQLNQRHAGQFPINVADHILEEFSNSCEDSLAPKANTRVRYAVSNVYSSLGRESFVLICSNIRDTMPTLE